jgi:hypothetical protein
MTPRELPKYEENERRRDFNYNNRSQLRERMDTDAKRKGEVNVHDG